MTVYYLGVDLGGTNIACGVVNRQGDILGRASVKTGLPATGEEIAARIADCCKMAARQAKCDMAEVSSVGIGTPGIANSDTGEVEYSCNLGSWKSPSILRTTPTPPLWANLRRAAGGAAIP